MEKGLGGNNDEVWSSAESGSMMGMYRHHKDGKIVFYELMIITEEKGSLLLRIKHFDAQLKGWESREESKEFPLVAVEKDAVYFAGLSFHRVNANRIDVDVAIQAKMENQKSYGLSTNALRTSRRFSMDPSWEIFGVHERLEDSARDLIANKMVETNVD